VLVTKLLLYRTVWTGVHHVADCCGGYRCADCRYIRQGGTWEVRYSVG